MRKLLLLSSLLLAQSCQPEPKKSPSDISEAVAEVKAAAGGKVQGKVTFTAAHNGVRVVADIDGLTPGLHGFHIHEKGDCSAPDFSSAGGHFNPTHEKHGGPTSLHHHVGDLGNIEADSNGHGHYDWTDKELQLNGDNSIIGRSIIVHSDKDDFVSQPAGNSGSRIGCGVIKAK